MAAHQTFTDEERAAMRERAKERKRGPRAAAADGEDDVLAKIAEMDASDRAIGERLHALITAAAPDLSPRTWYGMPAYARDGKVLCFFRDARKFKTRYPTFGFSDKANLDDGAMWATDFALTEIDDEVEATIRRLLQRAVADTRATPR